MLKIHAIIFSFLFLNAGRISAQDSLSKKVQHVIGFEIQRVPHSSKSIGHESTQVYYESPGYNFFYRFLIPNKKKWVTAFTTGLLYRQGYGSSDYSGLAGGEYFYGNFEYKSIQIGIFQFKRCGKRKNFNIGFGVNYGRAISLEGTLYYTSFLAGKYSESERSISGTVPKDHFSFNFEISQAFKLISRHYANIGVKQYIESPDFGNARLILTSSLFLAYNIR